jgi:hypothetical protein
LSGSGVEEPDGLDGRDPEDGFSDHDPGAGEDDRPR